MPENARRLREERGGDADELLPQAVEMAIDAGQASVAMYQKKVKGRLSARCAPCRPNGGTRNYRSFDGTKAREVLITKAEWYEMFMRNDDSAADGGAEDFEENTE